MGKHIRIRVRKVAATLRSGRRVTIAAWVLDSGRSGPCLWLNAAQHGNEVQGSEAIKRFVRIAAAEIRCGSLIAVPFANPLALHLRRPHATSTPERPYADDRGQNMNRTWPGRKHGNDTERLSYALYSEFGEQATHVLDLHCWSKSKAPMLLIRDRPDLREIAVHLGPRFVEVRPPNEATLAGMFCSTGRVGMSYECSGQYLIDEQEVQRALQLVVNLARVIGILSGRPRPLCRPVLFSDRCSISDVRAPRDGLFAGGRFKLGSLVRKGQTLGTLLSGKDLRTIEIVAPASGYLRVFGPMRPDCDVSLAQQHPYVSRGDLLASIAIPDVDG